MIYALQRLQNPSKDRSKFVQSSWTEFLQRAWALFLPFLFRDPHVLLVCHLKRKGEAVSKARMSRRLLEVEKTYNVRKHGTSEEDHMSSPRRIFDADFKFLQ